MDYRTILLYFSDHEGILYSLNIPGYQGQVSDEFGGLEGLLDENFVRMGRIVKSLSHMVMALSQTLQTTGADAMAQGLRHSPS